jgi:hypothetical protein
MTGFVTTSSYVDPVGSFVGGNILCSRRKSPRCSLGGRRWNREGSLPGKSTAVRNKGGKTHVAPLSRKNENEAATPSPGRISPNPVILRLIVMLTTIETGRIVRFRPPGRKMKAIPPPPPPQRISSIYPLERRATAPSPGPPSPHPGAH